MTRQQLARRQIDAAHLADALDAPPYPVVCQNGFYAFAKNGGYATAVTLCGVGRVYAKHFKEWAGRPLPSVVDVDDFRLLEPSAELLVAMLEAQKK